MDLMSLIGLDEFEAKKILRENGINNVEVVVNAKEDEKCNTTLVCAAKQLGDKVTLICGRFYVI